MAWRDRWRALLLKAGAPTVRAGPTSSPLDEFPATATSREQGPFQSLLDDIEATALAIYAAQGLPDQQGDYARNPRTGAWTFIADNMTPPERFALVEANPPEDGWRFGRLQDLGLRSDDNALIAAGALLDGVARMRAAQRPLGEDDLLAAIRLGEAWRSAQERTFGSSRLVLTRLSEDHAETTFDDSQTDNVDR